MTTLQKIQSNLKAPKGQYNSFGKYHYRSCEDIVEAVKPLLASVGATLTMSDSIEQIGTRYYVKATATFACGDESVSVCAYAREEETKKGMDGSQITGTASSYARKYALNGLFAIDDNKDADATNTHDAPPKRPAVSAAAPSAESQLATRRSSAAAWAQSQKPDAVATALEMLGVDSIEQMTNEQLNRLPALVVEASRK